MIRDTFRRFGCGLNKTKHGAAMKHCEANALDFFIYRMGAEKIKRMIKRQATTEALFEQAVNDGMSTLKQDGILKVLKGYTDIREVRRVCIN